MTDSTKTPSDSDLSKRRVYLVGAVAAMLAALIFRRNLGAAEIPLFTGAGLPSSVDGWFMLLHSNPLLEVTLLNFFDIIDYALVAAMFLAIYYALRTVNKSLTLTALTLSVVGTAVCTASNSERPMLSLSGQYGNAVTETRKTALLTAGRRALSSGYNPEALYQSTGFYSSLLLLAIAGMLISVVILQSRLFNKPAAYIGVIASICDLTYLAGLALKPAGDVYFLSIVCISAGGVFLMLWHLLIGIKLYRLSNLPVVKGGVKQ